MTAKSLKVYYTKQNFRANCDVDYGTKNKLNTWKI